MYEIFFLEVQNQRIWASRFKVASKVWDEPNEWSIFFSAFWKMQINNRFISYPSSKTIQNYTGTISQLGVTIGLLLSQILGLPSVLGTNANWPTLLGRHHLLQDNLNRHLSPRPSLNWFGYSKHIQKISNGFLYRWIHSIWSSPAPQVSHSCPPYSNWQRYPSRPSRRAICTSTIGNRRRK